MPNYPTSLDSLANPTATTYRDDPGFELDVVISTLNDIAEQVETKVGVGGSNQSPVAGRVLGADGTGTSSWRQVAAADVAPGALMKQLAKTTLGADTATVTFSSISGAYSSLIVEVFARGDKAATTDSLLLRVGNGSADSGANYDSQYILGTGSTPSATEAFAGTSWSVGGIAANTATAGRIGIARIVLPAYATTTFDKAMLSNYFFCAGTTTGVMQSGQYGGLWRSTAAIDTITILCTSNFKTGSVFTLWGAP